ncbi:MAG: hypothetical protein WCA09_10295 [Burkholderiales bacterium]
MGKTAGAASASVPVVFVGPGHSMSGALFLVALSTVMFEVLLTRVFSVTLWYHFAFMAISVAMFGMAVGAQVVFLRPFAWSQEDLREAMAKCALLLALTMVAAVFLHVYLFAPHPYALPVMWTFIATAVPFLFSGIFVSLALTRFPSSIGQLYAVDLAGAGIGCLMVFASLRWLDGIGAVLGCAGIAAAGALLLARDRTKAVAALVAAALGALTLWSGVRLARDQVAAFGIPYVKGERDVQYDYERWNSFSRIVVTAPDKSDANATAWSLSAAYKEPLRVPKRWLQIDAGAGTQLLEFDGNLRKLDFLRWDLTNFVHHLRQGVSVCIVGSGGGRDILAARVFGQGHVTAAEINPNILGVANGRFGDFTGHLDRASGVTLVNDEARSYFARSKDRCGILQLTFIDTWAATAAGAFALTENTLYTVEAWKIFLSRLDDHGVLAVARGATPELARLVSLGREALRQSGVAQPQRHMILVVNKRARPPRSVGPMGLLLVSKAPFTEKEIATVHRRAAEMQFDVELEPEGSPSQLLRAMATGRSVEAAAAPSGLNYDPPTDEKPFFFNMERMSVATLMDGGSSPAGLLMRLLLGVVALTLVCIVLPLAMSTTALVRDDASLLVFFAAIGAGFMLIEISMLQRFTVFLGHPTYSLTVILFVLLLAGGLGSRISARVPDARLLRGGVRVLTALIAVLVGAGFATVPLVDAFQASPTPLRVGVTAAMLAAIGIFMGAAFPLGMRIAMRSRPELGPWLWGINGATSVLASVLAVVIAMAFGISASFWTGVACYLVAVAAFPWAGRRMRA